jgi:Tfp pilus assembly protein PilV
MKKNTDNIDMSKLKNNSGFSLVEIVVAMALMTVTVGGVMLLVSDNTAKNIFKGTILGQSACSTEANRILNAIKEKGAIRSHFNMNTASASNVYSQMLVDPNAVTTSITPTSETAAQEAGISSAIRWPNGTPVYDLTAAATAPIVRPQSLIMGYMTALQAIYKSDKANFCTAANGAKFYSYSGSGETGTSFSTIFTDPVNTSMDELEEYIKIEPFDTASGSIVGSCPDVEPRPPRPNESAISSDLQHPTSLNTFQHPTSASLVLATVPSTVLGNRGFLVTAKVVFKDRAGRPRECQAQERFQYNMQPRNPATTLSTEDAEATISDTDKPYELGGGIHSNFGAGPPTYDGTYATNNYLQCNDTASADALLRGTLNVRIRYARSGSIMLCRNLSTTRTRLTAATTFSFTAPVRHTYYSTEMMKSDWYTSNALDYDGDGDLPMITGAFYPIGGPYYCLGADGCTGFPFFPTNTFPGALGTDYISPISPPSDGYEADGTTAIATVRYYRPESGRSTKLADTTIKWTPCERISVCGIKPTVAAYVASPEGYHMTFGSLPDGCDVNIQVAEVDAAFNVATTTVQAYMHEKLPGNYVCNAGSTGAGGHGVNAWFYACSAGLPAGFVACSNAIMTAHTPCCYTFPDNPRGMTPRAYVDP